MEAHFYAGPGNAVIEDRSQCLLSWLDHGKLMCIAQASCHSCKRVEDMA